MAGMFTVDEPTAEAIRRAYADGGELAGMVELRRHFTFDHGQRQRKAVRAGHRRVDTDGRIRSGRRAMKCATGKAAHWPDWAETLQLAG
jgi:hypothetical protein